jgi:hypothetical protein
VWARTICFWFTFLLFEKLLHLLRRNAVCNKRVISPTMSCLEVPWKCFIRVFRFCLFALLPYFLFSPILLSSYTLRVLRRLSLHKSSVPNVKVTLQSASVSQPVSERACHGQVLVTIWQLGFCSDQRMGLSFVRVVGITRLLLHGVTMRT